MRTNSSESFDPGAFRRASKDDIFREMCQSIFKLCIAYMYDKCQRHTGVDENGNGYIS